MPHGSSYRTALLVVSFLACSFLLFGDFFPVGAQSDEATLFTEGYQAYLKGDTEKAIATLNDVLKQFPNGRVNDLALYWLGKSYQKAGRTQEAIVAYRTLKTKYPESSMFSHAVRQLATLEKAGETEPKAAKVLPEQPAPQPEKPETKPAEPKPEPAPEVQPLPKEAVTPPAEPKPTPKTATPPKAVAKPKPKPAPKTEAPPQVAAKPAPKPAPPKATVTPKAEPKSKMEAKKEKKKGPARPPLSSPPTGEPVFLVVERVADVEATGVGARYVAVSGETLMVPIRVTNRGNAEDAFLLTSTLPPAFQPVFFHDSDGSGTVKAGEPSVTETPRLGTGQHAQFLLRARLPVEMNDGVGQSFEIKITSKFDTAVAQTAPTTLIASAPSLRGTFTLDREKVKPGDVIVYTLKLSNVGTADARSARVIVSYPGALRLVEAAPSSTSVDPQLHTVTWDLARLGPKDPHAVRLDFRVGEDALADQELGLRAVLQSAVGEQTVSVVSTVAKVEAVAGVRVAGAEPPRTVFPRETVYLPFTLRNTGNGPDRFALQTQSDLSGAVVLVEDRNRDGVRQPDEPEIGTTRLLNPQEEVALLAQVTVPPDAPDATRQSIRLTATSERSRSAVAEAGRLVVVSRPVVTVATQMAAKEGIPGKVFSYQLVCTNAGTSPARRVLVSESLPPELEFVDAQPRPGQVEGQRLAWEIADLGSGQKEILTVGVRVKKGIPAGTPVRKTTLVRYRDMNDQLYESSPAPGP
ncbi:MAG TPA: tetratricopeptide repeat protein [Nitrospirales bacterium]